MSIFKKYSYWINSGKYTAIQKFSVLGMGIVSFMLLARIMDTKEFGVWGLFMVISSTAETARISLIKNAFIRFMHQTSEEEQGSLQTAAISLSGGISVILAIAFFSLSFVIAKLLHAPSLAIMLQWYAVTLMVSVWFTHFEMLLNAKMHFKGICWMYCIRQGLLMIFISIYFVTKTPITPFLLSMLYLLSYAAGTFAGWWYGRQYVQWNLFNYRSWLSKLINFGKYVFGNNISSLLFRSTDNFITARKFGTGVSAYYNSCLRISNLVDMPSQVFADILFPKAAKFNSTDKESIKNMYEKSVGAILIFSLPALLILVCFPETILHILAGKKYEVAAPILRITAFFGFALPFLKQFGTIMDATGHPDTNFRVMFLALCINIVANLVGVHFFGVIGAACGTAFTYAVIFTVSQIILGKRYGINVVNVFKNTFNLAAEIFASRKLLLTQFRGGQMMPAEKK